LYIIHGYNSLVAGTLFIRSRASLRKNWIHATHGNCIELVEINFKYCPQEMGPYLRDIAWMEDWRFNQQMTELSLSEDINDLVSFGFDKDHNAL